MRNRRDAKRERVAALGLALLAPCGLAHAREIKLPEGAPKVAFEVPDDWTMTRTPAGWDFVSPDKTAIVLTAVIPRERTAMADWQKGAVKTMETLGVSFDPKATKSTTQAAAGAPATVFSGAPSIGIPEQASKATTAYEDKSAAGETLEQLTGRAPVVGPKIPYKLLVLYGASMKGEPVDVQFLNFNLAAKQLFLVQQESGKTDDRAVAIVNSVRPIK